MIVSTTNQKGGVGKSTLAVHMVIWLRENGIRAALVDADVQSSSSVWAKEVDPETPVYRFQTADEILDRIGQLEEEVIVIDGARWVRGDYPFCDAGERHGFDPMRPLCFWIFELQMEQ